MYFMNVLEDELTSGLADVSLFSPRDSTDDWPSAMKAVNLPRKRKLKEEEGGREGGKCRV